MIYNQDQPSTNIYLVIEGKVKVSRISDDGMQVLVDIYQADEFFGETAFLRLPRRSEQATCLENTPSMIRQRASYSRAVFWTMPCRAPAIL